MEEVFIKKEWNEENIIFYMHFCNENAIRQIEVSPKGVFLTSKEHPLNKESMLYDQLLSELDLNDTDFISKDEFMKVWNENL